jgi:hypothetical protein
VEGQQERMPVFNMSLPLGGELGSQRKCSPLRSPPSSLKGQRV